MNNQNIINLNDVSFSYEEQKVLQNITFTVKEGEFICLTGKSGCGKSTLLRIINGLLHREKGTIEILDKNIDDWNIYNLRKNMGYVLQEGALFPHLTSYQNMCYCMKLKGMKDETCRQQIENLLLLADLDKEILNKFPHELSGGQQQRVGIIRAIAHKPKIILMDEPFSALDPETRMSIHKMVMSIHNKFKTTFVMVTHDMDEAEKLSTRAIDISNGEIRTLSNG